MERPEEPRHSSCEDAENNKNKNNEPKPNQKKKKDKEKAKPKTKNQNHNPEANPNDDAFANLKYAIRQFEHELHPTSSSSTSRSAPRITQEDLFAQIVQGAKKQVEGKIQRQADDPAMAARANRPRPGPSREDPAAAQEETSMWNQIVADLKICNGIKQKASELVNQAIELERIMGKSTLPSLWQ